MSAPDLAPPLAPDTATPATPVRARILIVDDEEAIRDSLLSILTHHGYEVEVAADGHEALARLATGSFDAVLTDVFMPGSGGLDVIAWVRREHPDLPVLLMTGDSSLRSAIAGIEHGAVAYLTKPVSRTSLLPALEKAVQVGAVARARRVAEGQARASAALAGDDADLRRRFERALITVEPAFQPIVDVSARRVVAYEALLRTSETTFPRPIDVIEAADHLGRLPELGRAMRAATAACAVRLPEGCDLFANLHVYDLADDELYDDDSPLSAFAARTVLELTERATLDRLPDVEGRVTRLRLMGFRFAIDDLGAGYAGLTRLVQLHPDIVKLDISPVRDVEQDESKQRVVGAMVELADRLGIRVICEGVETVGERDYLASIGATWQQGFLFGRPGPGFGGVRWG